MILNLSFKELEDKINISRESGKKSLALLPIGCFEQHGPFLPMETDSIIATGVCRALCDRLTNTGKYWGFIYPTIHYTPTQSNSHYTGTVTIPDEYFRIYTRQVCQSILTTSFDALIIFSGHGSSDHSLKEIGFWQVNQQFENGVVVKRPVIILSIMDLSNYLEQRFGQKPGRHADWREFLLLYYILGDQYFDEARIENLRTFKRKNKFINLNSSVYGIPIEYRSTLGVIGEPLPLVEQNYQEQAEELWKYLMETLTNKLINELNTFWSMDFSR